jgi:hypothetical protein
MNKSESVYDDMSETEYKVSSFLREINLYWEYERAVYIVDDKGRPRVWTPDFYLPQLGLYIEVVGNRNLSDYSWREKVYNYNKVPIIFLYTNEYPNGWKDYLCKHIFMMHQTRWELLKRCGIA